MAEPIKSKTGVVTHIESEQTVSNLWGLLGRIISSSEKLPEEKHFAVIRTLLMSGIVGAVVMVALGITLFGVLVWYGKVNSTAASVLTSVISGVPGAIACVKVAKQKKMPQATHTENQSLSKARD